MTEKDKGFARLTGGTLLSNTVDPEKLPPWLSEADLDYYAGEFSRYRLPGRLQLVSQPATQLGARRSLAWPADPPAVAFHCR